MTFLKYSLHQRHHQFEKEGAEGYVNCRGHLSQSNIDLNKFGLAYFDDPDCRENSDIFI
ncbi:MAG TPA: hypothetical protein PKJ64_02130 [bacterium]|nr:hypothetical protein [bacterium]HNF85116.1 hypothetical protein [bacterium]HNI10297.1 hypothetical protein [bacterium]HNJ71443.1 hypothetical protein [bacterium]HNM13540.1 hypothetical protein [bacterium]